MLPFANRREAGRLLAGQLLSLRGDPSVRVLGLLRGGVPVAFEVASALAAPLAPFQVRKLGVPGHEELAMGAVASGGVRVLDQVLIERLRIPGVVVDAVIEDEEREMARREQRYAHARVPPLELGGKTTVLVDDGLATGSTMRAAAQAARMQEAARVVVAVPVAPEAACTLLGAEVDQVVCLATPAPFVAVGNWYVDFRATSDAEVAELLAQSPLPASVPAPDLGGTPP
jgi:predicted phosphoribosyltransferase